MYVSGFPKKACQGCHISEGAGRIIFQLVSFYALGSKSMETKVKCFGNPIRELFPSRHFVTLLKITKELAENRERDFSLSWLFPFRYAESAICDCKHPPLSLLPSWATVIQTPRRIRSAPAAMCPFPIMIGFWLTKRAENGRLFITFYNGHA